MLLRILAALCLCGCGAAPTPEPTPPDPKPVEKAKGPAHPHPFRLVGPKRLKFEPSGAMVQGDLLWVVSDKGGWMASYTLPLQPGANAKVGEFFKVAPSTNKPGIKLEAVAPGAEALLLDTYAPVVVRRCESLAGRCKKGEVIDVSAVEAKYRSLVGEDVAMQWISYEGLASYGDHLWVGVRSYHVKATDTDVYTPYIIRDDGQVALDGKPWVVDGLAYSLSDMAVDGDVLWMTWSYEGEATEAAPTGVAGLLARAPIEPLTKLPGAKSMCTKLVGKPEGVAVWGKDSLVVVFDQDTRRKSDAGSATTFPLARNEDYAAVYTKADCK